MQPRTLPNNATAEVRAMFRFLVAHENVSVLAWASASGLSEGTIRKALKAEGAAMTNRTYKKLSDGAFQLTGERLHLYERAQSILVGRVGAGAEVHVFEGDSMQGFAEIVDTPPGIAGTEDIEALEIEGDSMSPLGPGWRVFYRHTHEGVLSEELGKLCVVRLRDGRRFLKLLRPGYLPGLFNLQSWNGMSIDNVDVMWAAKVLSIVQAG